ncbi:MAG: hypothetical protein JSV91_08750 [Phycisphaerales bacterium]|nr:MAG: hypothetical protein JSV91_08750 [Phycisphaerales bacterium]
MPNTQCKSIGLAMGRLRLAVSVCCWIVVVALATQVFVWSLINFTQVRYEKLEGGGGSPLIVEGPSPREKTMQTVTLSGNGEGTAREPVEANRVISRWDRVMASALPLTRGAGLLAMLVMIPLIAMGVLLGAGSATPGVENTVSSFCWATVTALLIMPVGAIFQLPWAEGGLVSYPLMVQSADSAQGAMLSLIPGASEGGAHLALARFVGLPAVCIAGLALVGLRFCAGVRAAMLPKEDMRLDPELEKEVSNIKPTSLIGGRMAGALSQAVSADPPKTGGGSPVPSTPPAESPKSASMPGARELSTGEAPKRLI